jgi:hypothetical protein
MLQGSCRKIMRYGAMDFHKTGTLKMKTAVFFEMLVLV